MFLPPIPICWSSPPAFSLPAGLFQEHYWCLCSAQDNHPEQLSPAPAFESLSKGEQPYGCLAAQLQARAVVASLTFDAHTWSCVCTWAPHFSSPISPVALVFFSPPSLPGPLAANLLCLSARSKDHDLQQTVLHSRVGSTGAWGRQEGQAVTHCK